MFSSQLKLPAHIDLYAITHALHGGTAYCKGGLIMTDTDGPVMTTQLVRGTTCGHLTPDSPNYKAVHSVIH